MTFILRALLVLLALAIAQVFRSPRILKEHTYSQKTQLTRATQVVNANGQWNSNSGMMMQDFHSQAATLLPVIHDLKQPTLLPSPSTKSLSIPKATLRKHSWKSSQHSSAFRTLRLPFLNETYGKNGSVAPASHIQKHDLIGGGFVLPPRLELPEYSPSQGLLFSGTGKDSYVQKEIVPLLKYLRDSLGIPNAAERRRWREESNSSSRSIGLALVASEAFLEGPLSPWIPFFDAVWTPDDLPYSNWLSSVDEQSVTYVKAVKALTMASAPFDHTIMLDFDTMPCCLDFFQRVLDELGSADIGLSNFMPNESSTNDPLHWTTEHNSAMVALNMKSLRTRILMGLYVQAFHELSQQDVKGTMKDQPSLMLALRAMSFTATSESPWASEMLQQLNLGPIQHVDWNQTMFCRARTMKASHNHCGTGSSCIVSHKPSSSTQSTSFFKIFGIGFKKTGTTSLDVMFRQVFDKKHVCCRSTERSRATTEIRKNQTALVLQLADRYQYFQDTPWAATDFYRVLAEQYPEAKFILTARNTDQWWSSVKEWVSRQRGQGQLYGLEKLQKYADLLGANSTAEGDMKQAYDYRNQQIRDYFQGSTLSNEPRLLELDLSDPKWKDGKGWEAFCKFVKAPGRCPTGDFPRSNPTNPEKHQNGL